MALFDDQTSIKSSEPIEILSQTEKVVSQVAGTAIYGMVVGSLSFSVIFSQLTKTALNSTWLLLAML